MTTRRDLLISLGAGALIAPLTSLAQPQGKVWRVGILSPRAQHDAGNDPFDLSVEALRGLGYIEGRNLVIERRYADFKMEALAAFAAELVRLKVDVILTTGTPAVRAAFGATKTIPIVAVSFGDPVASGFAASLSHPGGNITGMSTMGDELFAKRLEMLISVTPKVARIAWLVNPDNTAVMRNHAGLEAAAHKVGKAIVLVEARAVGDLAAAFARMVRERAGVLIVADEPALNAQTARIAELALQNKLPSIFANSFSVEAGGLMSYGPNIAYRFRRAAYYVDRILKGTKPADLPVEQPMTFELVINGKTAKALGLKIPQSLLISANKVIE